MYVVNQTIIRLLQLLLYPLGSSQLHSVENCHLFSPDAFFLVTLDQEQQLVCVCMCVRSNVNAYQLLSSDNKRCDTKVPIQCKYVKGSEK